MRQHPDQLAFRRTQLVAWAQSPKPEKAYLRTVIAAINALGDRADDTMRPHEATSLSLAIRRLRFLLEARTKGRARSYLPGRRQPGKLDRPLDL